VPPSPGKHTAPGAIEQPRTTVTATTSATAPSGTPLAAPEVVRGPWESAPQDGRPTARPIAGPESGYHEPRLGVLGVRPGTAEPPRGGYSDAAGRHTRSGGPHGFVPGGQGRSAEDDREHHNRYAVAESEFFEPDNDDGVLHDPFRPGSYVTSQAIGDDDE
jgi:hypothetical protein